MINQKSNLRKDYEEAYRLLRGYRGYSQADELYALEDTAVTNATLSYDNRDEWFGGWVNTERWVNFCVKVLPYPASVWSIPF